MLIKRVRITKASKPTYWYADKVGEVFFVSGFLSVWYLVHQEGVVDPGPPHHIDIGDVEVLEEFEGEVETVVTQTVKRTVLPPTTPPIPKK